MENTAVQMKVLFMDAKLQLAAPEERLTVLNALPLGSMMVRTTLATALPTTVQV